MAFDYLDRFEDGDASDWTNLVASNLANLSGMWLGDNNANNEQQTSVSPSFGDQQDPVSFEVEIEIDVGNSNDHVIYRLKDANSNVIANIEHEDGTGDVLVNGSSVASWSKNTDYEYRLDIDFSKETFDISRNGTTLQTNVSSVDTGITGTDIMEIENKTNASGSQRSAYVDDIAYRVPPDTPQNFAASQGANNGEIDTSWDDVSNEDSYNLYRNESGSVSTSDTLVTEPGQDVTSFTDTGLEDGEKFWYAVTAEDQEGESSLSNEDSAITILPQTNFDSVSNA